MSASKSLRHAAARADVPAEVLAELHPGQSVALLQALHILTRDGRLNQDSRRKLKQVNHLLQFIEPLLQQALDARGDVTLVDHGAGKSYLGFLLYDRFLAARPVGAVWGVEARVELVERSAALAQRLGFARMHFVAATVRDAMATLPTDVDVVTALHACDTATDDALDFALQRQARAIVVVPCCQAEVAAALRRHKALQLARTPLAELWRHPLHTREFGSQVTNVLRCLRLEASGYDVTVTELVGWEHSMKNELIIARRTGRRKRSAAERLQRMLDELGLAELRPRFAVA
ncbi:Methyltransferase domain protein [Tepidimonas thermarum]|uniref:Methyltransferase domain protein n=1 Tax=Tepidimonas thermarum TaxID=335431 RepID=A0A554WYH3_9BURK|nr:SAM-dependent methyltransferase [Tepidimonas thermarum]TSE28633.1 Methyltransferase domain protein [Tepidimonas thermarum]